MTGAGHRLRGYKCGVWAPGFEQFEDQELPTEVRDLCMRVPRKRHDVSLLGSAANVQYCMHVGLGQPGELPTQTTERVEKAMATLQSIERFASDQSDHVSFAKAWMLMGKGVAHALGYDFGFVPAAGDGSTAATLGRRAQKNAPSASQKRRLWVGMGACKTLHGGLGVRVAQKGFAAQVTYWSAVDLHKAVMTNIRA